METPLLILGGKGMLGQDLARQFEQYSPLVWDREELDITDREAVLAAFKELQPGTVINAAAYNLVDDAEEDAGFAIAMKVNAEGPENLALAAAEVGATFVHYSTDYVFAGDASEPYTEDAQPSPQSRYAESKRAGEERVLAAGGTAYILRTCRLFGAPGASEVSKQSFVDLMLHLAATKDSLNIVDEEIACPTYTPDLAAQTGVLIEGAQAGEYEPGIYHVTNEGGCTWYEFAQEIFDYMGVETPREPVPASAFPRPAARPAYSVLKNTKLPAMRSWQDALHAYLDTKK